MKTTPLDLLVPKAMEAAEALKALAHETRLLAVCHIGDGERSVQQLEELLGASQSNVSQHLARLKAAGILAARREGKQVFYRMRTPEMFRLVHALQRIYCPDPEAAKGGPAKRTGRRG